MESKETINKSLEYIEDNLETQLNIVDIASHFGYSEYHFSRMFKSQMKVPIMEYVKRRKLIKATNKVTNQENVQEEKDDEDSSDNTVGKAEIKTQHDESQSYFQVEENIFNKDINQFFTNYQEGCFLLKYADTNSGIVYNEPLTKIQRSPLSTFKILSSLIILEEQLVSDINQTIYWDQTVYQIAEWNGDQTLSTAFKESVVWVYERLLARLDKNTISLYLEEANYGNKDASAEVDFWLDSSLKISLKEQVIFLENLYYNHFAFKEDTINTIKQMMLVDQTENYKIYGKTGSDANGSTLFVGFIQVQDDVYFFGTYIKEENTSYNVAKDVTYKIANELFTNNSAESKETKITEQVSQVIVEEEDTPSFKNCQPIKEQSFDVSLNDWGAVRFVSCMPWNTETFTDASFYLIKDNCVIYTFPFLYEDNLRPTGLFDGISFVMFKDTNEDDKRDVIIGIQYITGAGPQGVIPFTEVRIYEDIGTEFVYNEELSTKINTNTTSEITSEVVLEYLKKSTAEK